MRDFKHVLLLHQDHTVSDSALDQTSSTFFLCVCVCVCLCVCAGVTFTRSGTTKCQNTTDLEHAFLCCLVSNMLGPEQQSVKIQRTSRLCMCKYDLVHRGQIDFKHNVLVQGRFLPPLDPYHIS